jgi:hypothetical protein
MQDERECCYYRVAPQKHSARRHRMRRCRRDGYAVVCDWSARGKGLERRGGRRGGFNRVGGLLSFPSDKLKILVKQLQFQMPFVIRFNANQGHCMTCLLNNRWHTLLATADIQYSISAEMEMTLDLTSKGVNGRDRAWQWASYQWIYSLIWINHGFVNEASGNSRQDRPTDMSVGLAPSNG